MLADFERAIKAVLQRRKPSGVTRKDPTKAELEAKYKLVIVDGKAVVKRV